MKDQKNSFLLIDSYVGMQTAIQDASEEFDLKAVVASNALEAEQIIQKPEHNIVGVMMDMHPADPVMDQLIESLRNVDPNLPILCYTSSERVPGSLVDSLKDRGIDGVVNKLNDLDELERVVNSLPLLRRVKAVISEFLKR